MSVLTSKHPNQIHAGKLLISLESLVMKYFTSGPWCSRHFSLCIWSTEEDTFLLLWVWYLTLPLSTSDFFLCSPSALCNIVPWRKPVRKKRLWRCAVLKMGTLVNSWSLTDICCTATKIKCLVECFHWRQYSQFSGSVCDGKLVKLQT